MSASDYLKYRIAEQFRLLVTSSTDTFDSRFQIPQGSRQQPSREHQRMLEQYRDRGGNDLEGYRSNYKDGLRPARPFDLEALEAALPRSQGNLPDHQWQLIQSTRADIQNLRNVNNLPPQTLSALDAADRKMQSRSTSFEERERLRHFVHADGQTISPEGLMAGEPRRMTVAPTATAPQKERVWSATLNNDSSVTASLDISTMPKAERDRILAAFEKEGIKAEYCPSGKGSPARIEVRVEAHDAEKFKGTVERLRTATGNTTGVHQIHPEHWKPIQDYIHPPRLPRVAGGAATAVVIGGIALATGSNPAQAAAAAASTIPGVGGVLAPNPHEAAVRHAADAWGLMMSAAGAWVAGAACGTAGSVVPVAGNAAGAAVCGLGGGVLGNLIGSMCGDEILRLHARYIQGKKDTVDPSPGEKLIMAALEMGAISLDKLKPIVQRANEMLASQGMRRRGVASKSFAIEDEDMVALHMAMEGNAMTSPHFASAPLEPVTRASNPPNPQEQHQTNAPLNGGSLNLPVPEFLLPSAVERLPSYQLNFDFGPLKMDKHVDTLREGQAIPADLQMGIVQVGRDMIRLAQSQMPPLDLTQTREFNTAVGRDGALDPVKVGALLFAASLERDGQGKLMFTNLSGRDDLVRISQQPEEIRAIAANVEAGRFSRETDGALREVSKQPMPFNIDELNSLVPNCRPTTDQTKLCR